MKILILGHRYELLSIDGKKKQILQFVMRKGKGYPGNKQSFPGTTLQDVIHCLLNRVRYLDNQIPCIENKMIIQNFQQCLALLEQRAAKRHHIELEETDLQELEWKKLCSKCGHTTCHC